MTACQGAPHACSALVQPLSSFFFPNVAEDEPQDATLAVAPGRLDLVTTVMQWRNGRNCNGTLTTCGNGSNMRHMAGR
jgi:hypothetical protein